MKKLHIFFLIMMITKGFVFAEDIKVKTGDVFGSSMTDYFTPVAKRIRGSWTCVSSIKNYGASHSLQYGPMVKRTARKTTNKLPMFYTKLLAKRRHIK